ncbi:PTS sugar transporter subunit IIB [Lactobacillus sp. ESL0679]|uniref:PTS sugar transporter subunit IIB n=1 Tax=unclassified Lactobacillus TaxID=2620435 RepID=UPI0023F73705|nr:MULTISPECIES: PTS sugar transporter subunit IIB [unclassified Lactobacillus]MDF7682698.1 PTS sugar transporter subunit IIB [Lactobacillus sp. ESL0679]WEV36112.1 PTS sugar transporter subunit IIB [Lactobacillus sp. ESL0677]
MKKTINLLAVCGSGTVSSTMVAEKAQEYIESLGFNVQAEELNPQQASERIPSGDYDLVVFTSPIPGTYDIPIINATGLLTGIGEEDVFEKIKEAITE